MNASSLKPFAVVTGGSSGIGYELARQFAKHGFDLLIVAEDEGIESAAETLKQGAEGCMVIPLQADLATEEGVAKLCGAIDASGRSMDAIALNAGVGVSGAFKDTSLEEELNLINLNIVAVVRLAKYAVRKMVAQGKGRILITSSEAATAPNPFLAIYAASKAFVLSFAEGIRNELENTGVTVTALMPGATNTNFFERAGMEDTQVGTEGKMENDPADVARQGFEALMAGKDHVVAASLKTKLKVFMQELMPEPMKAAQARKIAEPGTARRAAH
ncbi:MAG TPA: SDR family NAD(P)-dependent oxidoreductase [Alphaproteobacteria bacterium]|nr:SDR family NAD(P)-dependent oxidoreductase [Alphaproteobacteria bacterium]